MDSHGWRRVYHLIREADRSLPQSGRKKAYSDALIVAMYLWSVWHDRPLCWACQRQNYSSLFRPRKLPSVSQFCKRIVRPRCDAILQHVHQSLTASSWGTTLSFLDGRALRVGPYSKDREARSGYAGGGMAKGYKLHAWATPSGFIPLWSVMPLNIHEKWVGQVLLAQAQPRGLVLADRNYDGKDFYDHTEQCGAQLLTPLPKGAGGGHSRQSPARLRVVEAWRGIAGYVYRERMSIERFFGQQSSFGGGLNGLPAWVRTLSRVRRWVGAKLVLYHVRLQLRKAVS